MRARRGARSRQPTPRYTTSRRSTSPHRRAPLAARPTRREGETTSREDDLRRSPGDVVEIRLGSSTRTNRTRGCVTSAGRSAQRRSPKASRDDPPTSSAASRSGRRVNRQASPPTCGAAVPSTCKKSRGDLDNFSRETRTAWHLPPLLLTPTSASSEDTRCEWSPRRARACSRRRARRLARPAARDSGARAPSPRRLGVVRSC